MDELTAERTLAVYDTEWTSWEGFHESRWNLAGKDREIIQIGAVKLDVAGGFRELAVFQAFIKPRKHPDLSDYIINLTGITQEQVDREGVPFTEALSDFISFAGDSRLISFGGDHGVIRENCVLHGLDVPGSFDAEFDIRAYLLNRGLIDASWYSSDVPSKLGLELQPSAHDALNDSRAIASVLRHLRDEGKL